MFFFPIWPQKVQNHSTYYSTHICLLLKVLPRTFTHNVFFKGVQHVKLPADNQKSLAYTTAGSTGKAHQKLWNTCWIHSVIAPKRDLWNLFLWYQCYSNDTWTMNRGESYSTSHLHGNNGWKFDKKANIKMHIFF